MYLLCWMPLTKPVKSISWRCGVLGTQDFECNDYVLVMLEAPLIKPVNPEYVVGLEGFTHFECHHSGGH